MKLELLDKLPFKVERLGRRELKIEQSEHLKFGDTWKLNKLLNSLRLSTRIGLLPRKQHVVLPMIKEEQYGLIVDRNFNLIEKCNQKDYLPKGKYEQTLRVLDNSTRCFFGKPLSNNMMSYYSNAGKFTEVQVQGISEIQTQRCRVPLININDGSHVFVDTPILPNKTYGFALSLYKPKGEEYFTITNFNYTQTLYL